MIEMYGNSSLCQIYIKDYYFFVLKRLEDVNIQKCSPIIEQNSNTLNFQDKKFYLLVIIFSYPGNIVQKLDG